MSSAREALIAEALGDIVGVLDRVEAVKPAFAEACEAVVQASAALATQATAIESRIAAIADMATAQAIKHVARRTDELARAAGEEQIRAMEAAAHRLFQDELSAAVRRLTLVLDHRESLRPSVARTWWSHAATAAVTAAITWGLALFVLANCLQ